ncbi:hypothetical protein [Collimonas sp. PA-H2]|uniref:hypothetical protein n=1 Tax=Collimonas sp. PA-H2 TaxID=1881062 RepID=UPI000BF715BF|nr:hypothetical protein [Collimonas sp. PA-H2]
MKKSSRLSKLIRQKRQLSKKREMKEEKTSDTSWDRTYKGAQIFALVVMPFVVAAIGWKTQTTITDASMRKDLVQIALPVLREARRPDDEEIRKWAREIMTQNSPVPFSSKAAEQLSTSTFGMLHSSPLLKPAMEKRPKCPSINLETIPKEQQQSVQALQQLCNKNGVDLFWLQIYLNMISKPAEATQATPK